MNLDVCSTIFSFLLKKISPESDISWGMVSFIGEMDMVVYRYILV